MTSVETIIQECDIISDTTLFRCTACGFEPTVENLLNSYNLCERCNSPYIATTLSCAIALRYMVLIIDNLEKLLKNQCTSD